MSEYNIEQLLKKINELETELKTSKKYGLVWDKENIKEDVVINCESNIPVLNQINELKIENGCLNNIIIEGDNYHSLVCLNYILKNSIDIIYIDPPYNTGAKNWRYNNNFVDIEDNYKHSRWLNMMEKRLILAKKLLTEDGALICAIDENEVNDLGILLHSIFGPSKIIDLIAVMHNPGGIQGNNFSYNHEYCYFVYPNRSFYIRKEKRNDGELTPFRDWGKENSKRNGSPNCFYPIYIKNGKVIRTGNVPQLDYHPSSANIKLQDGTIEVWPIDGHGIERRWRFAFDTVHEILDELEPTNTKGEYQIQRRKRFYTRKTMWLDSKYNANIYGTQLLSTIIDEKFPFPKSLYLVKDCIEAVCQKKDAIILDFFAGSGTTGHAVLELNREDKGQRRFILCTNNENNICRDVTYERMKTVITGLKKNGTKYSDGLPANLYYFKTDFIEDQANTEQARYNLVEKVDSLLCIAEDVMEEVERNDYSSHFINGDKHLFIYNDYYNETKFDEFKQRVLSAKGQKIVYVYASDNNIDETLIEGNDIELKPIPSKIYEIYKEIVEDIKRGE